MNEIFKDLVVVELASVLAGPLVGSFFSELGAKVIKIENPNTGGDVTRQWKLPTENQDSKISNYYACANYNKETLWIDYSTENGYAQLCEKIAKADIVIGNFKMHSAVKWNLDYESIKAINPKIIYANITGYGSEDNRPAYDLVLQAETGYISMTGDEHSGLCKMPVALIDILAAHHLKEAILCAMLKRSSTGEGSQVSVSLYDAALASLANQATNYLMSGHIPKPMGTLHPNIAPYGDAFETQEGKFLLLAIGSDQKFKKFSEHFSLDTTAFENNTQRVKNRQRLHELIQAKLSDMQLDDICAKLKNLNIPYGIVKNLAEVFEDPAAQRLLLKSDIDGQQTLSVRTALI